MWRLNSDYDQEFVLDSISFQTRKNNKEGPSYVYTWTFTLYDEEGTKFHAYLWLFGSHQYGEGMSHELDYCAAYMSNDYGQLVIEKHLGEQLDFAQYRRLKSSENPDEPDYLFVYKENNVEEIANILTEIYFEEKEYVQGVGLRCKVTDKKGKELYSIYMLGYYNERKRRRYHNGKCIQLYFERDNRRIIFCLCQQNLYKIGYLSVLG